MKKKIAIAIAAMLPLIATESPLFPRLTSEERQRVDAALPKELHAKPLKPRKLLVSTLCVRDGRVIRGHPSIPFGEYAISQMGKKLGGWEVVSSDSIEMFRPEKIRQFDAVCFNNTLGVLFEDQALRDSLLGWIANGGGFVGFHAAAATFVQHPVYDQWPAFGQMVGGTENGGHPWKPNEKIWLKADDPGSPLVKMFGTAGFEVADEIYQLQEQTLRDRLHVLLSVDTDKSDMDPKRRFLKLRAADKDFPVSWIKPHGKGRVFYTSLGHNADIFWNPVLLDHFLAGIQYALGDLKADDTPSAKLPASSR
jgi:type 1 glutamine amidotransferase